MTELAIIASIFLLLLVGLVIMILAYYWGPKGPPRN